MTSTGRGDRGWRALASHLGVEHSYRDGNGVMRSAADDSVAAVVGALLGGEVTDPVEALRTLALESRRMFEPVYALWLPGPWTIGVRLPQPVAGHVECEIACEDGTSREWRSDQATLALNAAGSQVLPLPALEAGYHQLHLTFGGQRADALLIVAPVRAYESTEARQWGGFLPLYALRSRRDWGIGDYRGLRNLGRWLSSLGAASTGTLPLLAAFLDERIFEPSPYSPASRLMWNEVFLDAESLPGFAASAEVQALVRSPDFQREIQALRSAPLVDYRRAAALKRRVVAMLAASTSLSGAGGLESLLDERLEVAGYARFRAVSERHGPWQQWPAARPDFDQSVERYHAYAQWAAETQIESAAGSRGGAGLYLDLPLGVNGAGYDTWRWPASFLRGLSAGAPPDALATQGQNWGFPPLHPLGLRESRYDYVIAFLRHHLRHAGRLRIDHAMGFHRLFVIPDGADATAGAYVHYPAEELYAILSLESHRYQTEIVGENLGTVPGYANEAMSRHGLSGMYVLPFEIEPWAEPPLRGPQPSAATSLDTHDLPMFAAWWAGDDISGREKMGLLDDAAAKEEQRSRGIQRDAVVRHLAKEGYLTENAFADAAAVRDALLRFLASSAARLVLVNLEDLWGETEPQNVPGTSLERPNWRRKARLSLEEMQSNTGVEAILRAIDAARQQGRGHA